MCESDAFLRAILDEPDADAPRLVYADWLDDRSAPGDAERAEFIRTQCELARIHSTGGDEPAVRRLRRREAELLRAHGREWAGPLHRVTLLYDYRRGFIEDVTVKAAFVPAGATALAAGGLFDLTPVRTARLIGVSRKALREVLAQPGAARLLSLHLTDNGLQDHVGTVLANCPNLHNLRVLRLGNTGLGDSGAGALAESNHLAGLRVLVLANNPLTDHGAIGLAAGRGLAGVRELDLSGNQIGAAGAAALVRSPNLAGLRKLDLRGQFPFADPTARRAARPVGDAERAALRQRFGAGCLV